MLLDVLVFTGLVMDFVAIVLLILQGRYLARMSKVIDADYRIMIPEDRRIEDIVKELLEETKNA